MSVVCVAWSSHVGALMSAASRPGMPSVRVLSSRMLEEPDGVERCLETMRSATALFVFRTTDALWDQLDEGIRLIGKTVPVVCVSYDPAAWALSSVPVETAQTAYRYLTYGGAENLGNLFRFLDALPNAAAVPEPVPVPWEGLWHPDAPVRAFATVRGYLEWYAGYACERGLSLDPERTVGLLFGRHYWVNDMPDVEAALVHALEAKGLGVLPGPSGIITRGREDILPTGRNFYALDPRRLPTRAAWRVGQNLARALIAKHLKEEGRYPENVAMFWMCNDMMWADGEGMGQLLYLLGVVPRWLGNGMVEGFDVIPLQEMGRPRIDVTVRVSGLLRDSFPAAMHMLDAAVQAVAALDEPLESNFVRKHTQERLAAIEADDPDAWRSATFRIFSSEPGTYQAGVNLAVYASAWQTEADLADIFLHWNGYAYGKDAFGVKRPRALEASLSTVDVTYNKVVSDEHDLFNCCGYYGTHGGMTAAASHFRGGQVKTYYGDTREPEQVQVRDLTDEVRRVVRARLLNPKWIEGMKRHGYKGAGDISKRTGRVYGWEATTQAVDDWIFDDIAKTFVLDPETRAFFDENNPWALEEIARRLLEAEARHLWKADPDVLAELREAYMDIEGTLEDRTEAFGGEFQGGSIDIVTSDDVAEWKRALEVVRGNNQ